MELKYWSTRVTGLEDSKDDDYASDLEDEKVKGSLF